MLPAICLPALTSSLVLLLECLHPVHMKLAIPVNCPSTIAYIFLRLQCGTLGNAQYYIVAIASKSHSHVSTQVIPQVLVYKFVVTKAFLTLLEFLPGMYGALPPYGRASCLQRFAKEVVGWGPTSAQITR